MVARMAELLHVGRGDRVLEVGTGSGYAAAILAELGCRVTTIERDPARDRGASTAAWPPWLRGPGGRPRGRREPGPARGGAVGRDRGGGCGAADAPTRCASSWARGAAS